MKKKNILINIVFFTILISCNNKKKDFDTTQMIIDITDNLIIPKTNEFLNACDKLNNAILIYVTDINKDNLN